MTCAKCRYDVSTLDSIKDHSYLRYLIQIVICKIFRWSVWADMCNGAACENFKILGNKYQPCNLTPVTTTSTLTTFPQWCLVDTVTGVWTHYDM